MPRFARRRGKPRIVWRVEPDASYCDVYGLQARGEPIFEDSHDYEFQRQRHLNWDWSLESPFQSTFSCKVHAIRWGRQVYDKGATLYQIKTRGLRTDRGDQRDELLIVGDIPPNNVHKIMVLEDEFERMMDRQRQRFEPSDEEEEEEEGSSDGGYVKQEY